MIVIFTLLNAICDMSSGLFMLSLCVEGKLDGKRFLEWGNFVSFVFI